MLSSVCTGGVAAFSDVVLGGERRRERGHVPVYAQNLVAAVDVDLPHMVAVLGDAGGLDGDTAVPHITLARVERVSCAVGQLVSDRIRAGALLSFLIVAQECLGRWKLWRLHLAGGHTELQPWLSEQVGQGGVDFSCRRCSC